jgi:hypothetical protein
VTHMSLSCLPLLIAAFTGAAVLGVLVLLKTGIRRGDRTRLDGPPASHCDAVARRILLGVRSPLTSQENDQ